MRAFKSTRSIVRQAFPACLFLAVLLVLVTSASAKELVVALPAAPETLDPHRTLDPAATPFIAPCYQRLTEFKEGGEVKPSLAVTWRVSQDERLYTFVLEEGAKFSDGRAVDAQAVFWSFDRLMRLGLVGPVLFPELADIEVIGPRTVRFILHRPQPWFLAALASPSASIVSPGLADLPPGQMDRHSLGGGVYRIDSAAPSAITLALRRDSQIKPAFDRVRYVIEPDPARRLKLLKDGEVQIAFALSPENLEEVRQDERLNALTPETMTTGLAAFNCRRPWLTNVEVRRALARAVDYQALLQAIRPDLAVRLFSPVPVGLWGRSSDIRRHDYNPEEAKKQLAALGPPPGPLKILHDGTDDGQRRAAERIGEAFEAVGLKVESAVLSGEALRRALTAGEFDLALAGRRPLVAHPGWVLTRWLASDRFGPEANLAFYAKPEVDAWLAEAETAVERKTLLGLYAKLQAAAAEDAPYLYLYQTKAFIGAVKTLGDFTVSPAMPEALPLTRLGGKAESKPDRQPSAKPGEGKPADGKPAPEKEPAPDKPPDWTP